MARKIIEAAVSGSEDDGWDVQCPGFADSPCGEPGGAPFRSTGWPTKATASARAEEHFAEHRDGTPMSSLDEFRAKHGLTPTEDGLRAVLTTKDI
jgi:hypothetical protein